MISTTPPTASATSRRSQPAAVGKTPASAGDPSKLPEPPRAPSATLGRLGHLEVRLATDETEIAAALALRHRIFVGSDQAQDGIDRDRFDAFCDHLVVVDHSKADRAKTDGANIEGSNIDGSGTDKQNRPPVIATYRLLGCDSANKNGGFYSQGEFDVARLTAKHDRLKFLEFGRSCVLPEYRTKRTIELLWHGNWAYVRRHDYDVMFGCASFPGDDPTVHDAALSFLQRHAAAEPGWQVAARPGRGYAPSCSVDSVRDRAIMRSLPALIKGYLRLGAMFAEEAVADSDFGTTDVLVLLPLHRLNPRYVSYYGEDAGRHAVR